MSTVCLFHDEEEREVSDGSEEDDPRRIRLTGTTAHFGVS